MIHRHAAVAQEVVDLGKVPTQVIEADVLEHADAGDLVESLCDIAVIQQADFTTCLQLGILDATRCFVELLARQRDADAVGPVLARRPDHQRTPAAADVE